jgi:putative transposase
MGNKKFSLYIHLVWATWNREMWISQSIERRIYRNIVDQVHHLGCQTLAINGMPDHIHLLIKYSTTVTLAKLMKQAKGVSSRFINDKSLVEDHFKWKIGYGAFTVSRWDICKIISYVNNQKQHHQIDSLISDLEKASNMG